MHTARLNTLLALVLTVGILGHQAARAQEDLGSFSATKCEILTQTSASSPVVNSTQGFVFYSNLLNGASGSILPTSTITSPVGGSGTFGFTQDASLTEVYFNQYFDTKAQLDAAFPNGNAGDTGTLAYQLTINTSTPNSYPEQFTFGPDAYPSVIPQITNGTWSNGCLVVTDPTQPVTLTWPVFSGQSNASIHLHLSPIEVSGQLIAQDFAGDGTQTQYTIPANTLTNNAYYTGSLQFNNSSTGSPCTFQQQVNFTVQVGTPREVSFYQVQKQEQYDQSSSAGPTADPRAPFEFSSQVFASGTLVQLLSTSNFSAPTGSPIFYNAGTSGLDYQQRFTTKAAMDAAYTTGTYTVNVNTSTPNAYTGQVTLGADNYPPIPQIVGMTNATWSNGRIVVIDNTQPVTLTWNSFNSAIGQINFGFDNLNVSGQFASDGTHNSITFTPNTSTALGNNQTYQAYLDFSKQTGLGTTGIPGAGSAAIYQTQVQFYIQTGGGSASSVSASTTIPLVYKQNVLLQTANSAPVNAAANTSESDGELPPYGFSAQTSAGGSVTGPGAGSPYLLSFDAGTNGDPYIYSSGSLPSATVLNSTYPDGAYTFKDTTGTTVASLTLTGDVYPNVPQILTVNGLTPTWNGQGQLVLDPAVDNVIAWTPFTTTNANYTPLTGGYESAQFESSNSSAINVSIELQSGIIKGGSSITEPFSSLRIPAHTMTSGSSYHGNIEYFLASSGHFNAGVATSAAGYITQTEFTAIAVAQTPPVVTFVEKNHVVQQSGNSAPADVAVGVTSPAGNLGPYSFYIQSATSGGVNGPSGGYTLTYDVGDQAYEFNSAAFATQPLLDATDPDGSYSLPDGNSVNLTGDEYPTAPQLLSVNGAAPVWNSSGQLVIDPSIENTLTWSAFPTNFGTFATVGFEELHLNSLAVDRNTVSIKQTAIGAVGGSPFTSYTIPPNTLVTGDTYPMSISYQVEPTVTNVAANTYDLSAYLTENMFTIAPQTSSTGANDVAKASYYNQTSASPPTLTATPYAFFAAGDPAGSITAPAGAGVPGPYSLASGGGSYLDHSFTDIESFNIAYLDGTYTLTDGTSVNLTGEAYPIVPQVTQVNGAAPVWSNGELVLNPAIDNTITWTAYTGNFATGQETLILSGIPQTGTITETAFGPGSGTISTVPFNSYTIPAGTLTAGTEYPVQLDYDNLTSVVRQGSGAYDYAAYSTLNNFTILASSENSVEKEHVLQQMSNIAPTDYAGPANDPGPYNFHAFGAAGQVVGPLGSYTLTFLAVDNTYEFFSSGFASLAGLNANYPDGTYTLTDGVAVPLTGDVFPNIVQVTAVNGAPPVWNAAGQLELNPAIDNTLTWTPFTASNGSFTYATGGIEHIEITGNQDSVDVDQQSAGPLGQAAFNTLTIPSGELTSGNTYTGSFIYQLASGGTFGTVPSLAVYLTNTYVNFLATGTTLQSLAPLNGSGIPNQVVGNAPITLSTSSISGGAITYTVTGPATLGGANLNVLTLTGAGQVTVTASVQGTAVYAPATLSQSFYVNPAPPVQQLNALTILHSFGDGTVAGDGLQPGGALIQGSDGYFYGMTQFGGSANQGAIFKVSTLGQVYIIHSFEDGSVTNDGAQPFDALVQGTDGNFYGTTTLGGQANSGTAFKVTPGGQVTILHSFGDTGVPNDGSDPQAGLIQGSDGNFYGVTFQGGANGAGVAYQMSPAGAITILHSFGDGSVANDGLNPIFDLVQGRNGNFYGTAPGGGAAGLGCVFAMTPAGAITILHSFGDGTVVNDGAKPFGALVQGSDGNFYGTTLNGGSSTLGCAYKITPGGAVTLLHSFGDGTVSNDGTNPADLLVLARDGNFYATTRSGGAAGQGVIYKMSPQGLVTVLHSFGDGSVADDGAQDNNANSLMQASDGSFYGSTLGGGSVGTGTIFKLTLGIAQLTSPATASGTVSLPFSYQTTASTLTTGYSATNLPAGLSIDPQTGLISGTPTTAGTKTATLTLTGASGSNTAQVTITIVPLPVPSVTSILYAFGSLNTAFTYTPKATNNPTSYSATGLIGTGLSISSTTGVISGTPTAVGTFPVAISATNATGTGTASTVSIQILATPPTLNQEYVVLHRFNDGSTPNDGQNPFAIIQAFDGSYYGTTHNGGDEGDGVVFNMNVQGASTNVLDYGVGGGTNAPPVASQGGIQSSDGNFYGTTEYGGVTTSNGDFKKLSADGTLSLLHNFSDGTVANDGANPQGQPVQGRDGYFYGVTLNGGTASLGTVYKINSLGIETVLHSFGDGSVTNDGASPVAALIQGTDGNFYGTTSSGGAAGQGAVYEITPSGTVTILHSFGDGTVANDGSYPVTALIQGTDGNFYGTTPYGGTSGTGTIFQLTAQGYAVLHNFTDGSVSGDGANPGAALIQGIDGNFYGTTQNGGATGSGTVFELASSGYAVTILHSFSDGTTTGDGANPAGSLYQDTSGNFFGTTLNGGAGAGTVFVIVATQTAAHIPVFTGAAYATGSIDAPFTYTPKAMFGVLGDATGSSFVTALVSPSLIKPATSATSWTLSGTSNPILPNALHFNSTSGAITGTPLTAGTYTVTITPRNSVGSGQPETITLYIDVPPTITSGATASGSSGQQFGYQITGTAAPSAFGAINLPDWLSVDTTSGMVTGTPPGGGTYSFTPTATNYAGTGSEQVVLSVTGANPNAPSISSPGTASGTAGTAFTYTITASNSPTSYSALLLPTGLVFDSTTGIISGTPTTAGTYSVPIGAANDSGNSASELTITIAPTGAPTLNTSLAVSCITGNSFTYQIPANGLVGIYNATGLPQGLSVNVVSGVISGTPGAPGLTPITLTAANATGTASATLNLTVTSVPVQYSDWTTKYPALVGGPTSTPLNDGVPNALKYLFNIDPTVKMSPADQAALPKAGKDTTVTAGRTFLTLTYRQYAAYDGAAPGISTSSDLVTWTPVTPGVNKQVGTDPVTGDPIMEIGVDATGANHKFIRLNVTSP